MHHVDVTERQAAGVDRFRYPLPMAGALVDAGSLARESSESVTPNHVVLAPFRVRASLITLPEAPTLPRLVHHRLEPQVVEPCLFLAGNRKASTLCTCCGSSRGPSGSNNRYRAASNAKRHHRQTARELGVIEAQFGTRHP
jgi:hypothetical protein